MNLLLDTHTILWFWWNDPKLSEVAKDTIANPENRKLVSTASCWEVAIKVSSILDCHMRNSSLGKLP